MLLLKGSNLANLCCVCLFIGCLFGSKKIIKLNKYFEFPFKLDMKEYLVQNNTGIKTEYELTGITIHYGVADFGHYYDLIKGPDGKWYS